ncbi:hypothetical protein [Candidatus Accumulibacter sp. ACC007]|uniref:hypothetical protein n=1 Tax=Candidatus Accumulibacter sp. ACC007 TaxID=2823333 RepID=UPI0025BECC9B|nr:hypothetical protein [Candidatus Accumulibacter sp. ACC007]
MRAIEPAPTGDKPRLDWSSRIVPEPGILSVSRLHRHAEIKPLALSPPLAARHSPPGNRFVAKAARWARAAINAIRRAPWPQARGQAITQSVNYSFYHGRQRGHNAIG